VNPDPFWCPVEECDHGEDEETSLGSVRTHINASSDDAHDWGELKEPVEAQGEDDEGNEDKAGDDESDETPADEPDENADTDPSDGADDSDSHMPTDDELDRQREQATDSDDEADENEDDSSDTSSGLVGGIDIPVSTTTLAVGGVLFLTLALLYAYLRRGSESTGLEPEPSTQSEQSDDSPDDGDDEMQGGLVTKSDLPEEVDFDE